MTDLLTSAEATPARIGPGRLVLVVGPSGAGKDTLIDLARAACADDGGVVFARRIVTRAASAFENNEHVSLEDFARARAQGAFALDWDAHGLLYALPRAIDDDIRAGRAVVANVSRAVVGAMRAAYLNVVVVSVTAPPQVLAERLAARARASDGAISDRLERSGDAQSIPDLVIENVGSPACHARALVAAIKAS